MNVSMQIWFLSTCSSFRRGDTPADHMIRGTCHAEVCEALDVSINKLKQKRICPQI